MIDRMVARLFVRGGPVVCSKWAREWAGRWVVVGPVMVRGGPGGGAWLVGRERSQVHGQFPLFVCSFVGCCFSGAGTFAFRCV